MRKGAKSPMNRSRPANGADNLNPQASAANGAGTNNRDEPGHISL